MTEYYHRMRGLRMYRYLRSEGVDRAWARRYVIAHYGA